MTRYLNNEQFFIMHLFNFIIYVLKSFFFVFILRLRYYYKQLEKGRSVDVKVANFFSNQLFLSFLLN